MSEQLVPETRTQTCANGLHVLVSRLATTPMVIAHLAVPVRLADRRDLALTDVLSAAWADTAHSRELEELGGAVTMSRRRQWVILTLTCQSRHLDVLLRVLQRTVQGGYTEQVVRRSVAACRQQSRLVGSHPAIASQRLLWEQVYAQVPSIMQAAPEPSDFDDIDVADVIAAHARHIVPDSSRLVVVGDVSQDQVMASLEGMLAGWTKGVGQFGPTESLTAWETSPTVVVLPDDDLPATHIKLAARSLPITHPDAFVAASVASLVLGGNFSSRLNRTIRETEGIAYRAQSYLDDHYNEVLLVVDADVTNGCAGAAMKQISYLLDDLADHGPTAEELRSAVGYTLGSYILSLGSQHGRASCLLSYLTMGIGLDFLAQLPDRLDSLTTDDVRDVCQLYRPHLFAGVVVGNGGTDTRQGEFHYG